MVNDIQWARSTQAEYEQYKKLCEQYKKKPMTILQFILVKTNKRIH